MAEKRCSKCGETKPLEDFYRKARMTDGRDSWCKECKRTAQREWNAARRERMGEEAWLAHRREVMTQIRRNPRVKARDGAQSKAYDAAMTRLRELHRADFERLYEEERGKLGVPFVNHRERADA